jgi:hypothetical protein
MKYPLGIQTFSEIRQENYLYLDKTALIHELVELGKVYFLSRPRRFGKSLLISTLESLFLGDKGLFEGLLISKTNYDFAVHPVVKLEFAKDEYATADNLRSYIDKAISNIAANYQVDLEEGTYNQRFDELVVRLHQKTGQKVVLLIDEYDKPILNNLNKSVMPEIKQVMNAFYSVAKSLDEHLKFVFITGVSKFAKVSVFSGMNNLTDISLDKRYATLCGVTQQELESNFDHEIDELAKSEVLDRAAMLAKIKHWYNGYLFHPKAMGVYNPYSVLCLFSKLEFTNYWFTTATPTFLIELIKSQQFNLADLNNFEVDELFFAATEPEQMSPEPVLLQTGYLTIVDYDDGWYRLDFPNYEVRYAFNRAIVQDYGKTSAGDLRYIRNLGQALNKGEVDSFFKTLKIFFANIPYDITLKQEKYYQSLFYALFTLLGFQVAAEVRTNDGRIDCVLEADSHIYIIEFKLHESKEQALQQIISKQYAQKFQGGDKKIVLLGVEFDQDTRNIGGYIEKRL